jgi:hypothetical protein
MARISYLFVAVAISVLGKLIHHLAHQIPHTYLTWAGTLIDSVFFAASRTIQLLPR